MKTRLITLLTMGRTVDRARDRKGAYTLRYVNKFPKFGPVARVVAGEPARAGNSAPSVQSSLFEPAKAPVAVAPPPAKKPEQANPPNPPDPSNPSDRSDQSDQSNPPDQPQQSRAPNVRFRWFARSGAFLAAAAAVVPKTAARAWGRLWYPAADSRPRAQGELALEHVTVLRNDLSDADLVVVAVQPKPEDSRSAPADPRAPAGNTWTRVTARWIKLKNPADDGSQATDVIAGRDRTGGPLSAAKMRGGQPRGAAEWAQTSS
jgi:hypothetical protein